MKKQLTVQMINIITLANDITELNNHYNQALLMFGKAVGHVFEARFGKLNSNIYDKIVLAGRTGKIALTNDGDYRFGKSETYIETLNDLLKQLEQLSA